MKTRLSDHTTTHHLSNEKKLLAYDACSLRLLKVEERKIKSKPFIHRHIEEFGGSVLVVGCGNSESLKKRKHDRIHPSENHYTIDICLSQKPDLVIDFGQPIEEDFLPKNRFDLIVLENFSGRLTQDLFYNIHNSLSANGICVIAWTLDKGYENVFSYMENARFNNIIIEKLFMPSIYNMGDSILFICAKNEELLKNQKLLEELKHQPIISHLLEKCELKASSEAAERSEGCVIKTFFFKPISIKLLREKFMTLRGRYGEHFRDVLGLIRWNFKRFENEDNQTMLEKVDNILKTYQSFLTKCPTFFSPAFCYSVGGEIESKLKENRFKLKIHIYSKSRNGGYCEEITNVIENFYNELISQTPALHLDQYKISEEECQGKLIELLSEIDDYISKRIADPREYYGSLDRFFGGYSRRQKIEAADSLRSVVQVTLEQGYFNLAPLIPFEAPLQQSKLGELMEKFNKIRNGSAFSCFKKNRSSFF